ncbi:hypothetical protein KI387_008814 [Taxus chinensis]|uniref:HMA domain-containing protein n=1 Tax=Taxus chinensis TaxID=29808 RepID=A0AA38CPM3_TAXCH|nr:hypothetical protein KI387_008814 [Taxus chinensis]
MSGSNLQKIVVKLGIDAVTGVQGVDSVAVDMEKNQITVTGGVDPLFLFSKFRKFGFIELVSEEKKSESDAENERENKAQVERIVFVPYCRASEYSEDNLINSCDKPTNGCTIC